MAQYDTARGWSLPTAALTTYLAVEVLRVWLPSLRFGLTEGDPPLWLSAGVALGTLAAGSVVLAFIRMGRARQAWTAAMVLLVVGRIVLQFPTTAPVRLVAASIAISAAVAAMAVLAGSGPDRTGAYLGTHAGIAVNTVGHLALGTHDLIWRTDPIPVLVLAVLVAATLWAGNRTLREPGWSSDAPATAAWPWLLPGPVLLLVGVLAGVPARTAIAVGWPDGVVAAVLSLALLLGAAAAVRIASIARSSTRVRPWHGMLGAALVLVGTAGSLLPTGPTAVIAQVMLAIGVGVVTGVATPVAGSTDQVRRSGVALVSWLGFTAATVVYYGAHEVPLWTSNRTLLLAVAAVVAAAGVFTGRRMRRAVVPPDPTLSPPASSRPLIAIAVTISVLVGLVASTPPITDPTPGDDATFTVAQLNVRSGYDAEGRFAVDEVAAVLADIDADVIILNEVDRGWLVTGGHDVLGLLAAELDMTAVFAPAADEVWGNAVLSRFPIEEVSVERLPRGDAPMLRSQLAAVVRVTDDQPVAVVGSHLSLRVGPEDGTRLAQARAVAATVARYRERGLPVVVGGSFNVGSETPELETFEALVAPVLPQGTITWPSSDPTEHLDHLLVSEDLERVGLAVPFVQVSDHLPIVVTLRHIGEPADG